MTIAGSDLKTRLFSAFGLPGPGIAHVAEVARDAGGYVLTSLVFRAADGAQVRGQMCQPPGPGPFPAVLVIHAHGNRYDIGAQELTYGRPALSAPLGPDLAARGIASLCVDLPCFGSRAGIDETAAAKAALWRGKTLVGQMLAELSSQLDWLAEQPEIQADRIGVFGISMGATLGYWLAAVDDRVAALAQLCCFADFDVLVDRGAHDLHGAYLTVPGLLKIASNGQIAGLMAPRPQLIGIGDKDPLTPPQAVDVALAEVQAAYAAAPKALRILREPQTGHSESPAMRASVLRFFLDHLRGDQ